MREPDLKLDGWCLEDGESYHARAPDTFWIPDRTIRETLKPGDLVKLIFQISTGDDDVEYERMWVIVRECSGSGYLGILDNDPCTIEKNDELWSGIELPFSACNVIDFRPRNRKTKTLAKQQPTRLWS